MIFERQRSRQFPDSVAGSFLNLKSKWEKNEGIVCGQDHPWGGIVDCVHFHGRMRSRFELSRFELSRSELSPHAAKRNRHTKSLGGNLYDPDGVSRADYGGVWSHDLLWKKHRLVSGDYT